MEPKNTVLSNQGDNEISLKDLILKLQGWIRYLLGKWSAIFICGVIGAALGFIYSLVEKPKYTAELTFILEDSKSSPLAAYSGLASQFGIDLGAGAGSGIFSGDNILEFLKSRLMVEKTLLSPVIVNETPKSLADYYIEVNEMRESWLEDPSLTNLHFPINPSKTGFSLQQDSILQIIYDKITTKCLNVIKPDKALSFISVECTTKDELFSKLFTERLVKEATDFYVQTKTQRSKATVDKLQEKADSIVYLLNRKTYSIAASQDMNQNPARNIAGVNTELASRDKMVLQTMYIEVVKNLELSRMAMAQETPIIQVVDTPILPLEKKYLGATKGIILGGILGGGLIIIWILAKKGYKGIMTEE